MPDELLVDVVAVAEVAGLLGDGAAALDAAGARPAVAPDAGESTVVVAELLGSMCGAVGVYVEAMDVAGQLVTWSHTQMSGADTENARSLGGGS